MAVSCTTGFSHRFSDDHVMMNLMLSCDQITKPQEFVRDYRYIKVVSFQSILPGKMFHSSEQINYDEFFLQFSPTYNSIFLQHPAKSSSHDLFFKL